MLSRKIMLLVLIFGAIFTKTTIAFDNKEHKKVLIVLAAAKLLIVNEQATLDEVLFATKALLLEKSVASNNKLIELDLMTAADNNEDGILMVMARMNSIIGALNNVEVAVDTILVPMEEYALDEFTDEYEILSDNGNETTADNNQTINDNLPTIDNAPQVDQPEVNQTIEPNINEALQEIV